MSRAPLHLATDADRPETLSDRVRRAQAEARRLAEEQVAEMIAQAKAFHALCLDVATGGDLFAPGIRDEARRMAQDVAQRCTTIEAVRGRK